MSLLSLYNTMTKTAQQQTPEQGDGWARAAAAEGLSVEQYMDKKASQVVNQEAMMNKVAATNEYLGEVMALGYFDELTKFACADPVRDRVSEVHVKLAQVAKLGLMENMLRLNGYGEAAELIKSASAAEAVTPEVANWLSRMISSAGGAIGNAGRATGEAAGNYMSRLKNLGQRATGLGEGGAAQMPLFSTEGAKAVQQMGRGEAAGRLALEGGLPAVGLAGAGYGGYEALT